MSIAWVGEQDLLLNGVRFRFARGFKPEPPDEGQLVLYKPRSMIEHYMAFLDEVRPRVLVELGIFGGGSSAFYAEYAQPAKHVAFDLKRGASRAFDRWREQKSPDRRVRAHFEVDQSDGARLAAILDAEIGEDPIDLVIDDASHRYEPSRASFETLFPRLRPAGWYVIEDWSSEIGIGTTIETQIDSNRAFADALGEAIKAGTVAVPAEPRRPLEALVLELVLLCAGAGLIDDVRLLPGWAAFRRAADARPLATPFRVHDHIHGVARRLIGTVGLGSD